MLFFDYFNIAIFSCFFSFIFIPLMRLLAFKFNVLDQPDGRIKIHKVATPYLGGIGIYLAFILSISVFCPIQRGSEWLHLGMAILLSVGLIDDLIVFSPLQKLLGEIIAVACFIKGGFYLKTEFFSDFINVFCSGFWMLLVINAFNLVDVMDGLATILALIASCSFFIIAVLTQNYYVGGLIIAFLASLLVFFSYNRPPAKIYLGDAGALFIGGFLATMPLLFSWSFFTNHGWLAPLVILSIPLFEVTSLIIIRTIKGIPFYCGSPHHFSSYLKNKNWNTPKILIFTTSVASLLSFFSILFLLNFIDYLMFLSIIACIYSIWIYKVFST